MGRASRRKRDRHLGAPNQVAPAPRKTRNTQPVVYRFFQEEHHADALVQGYVWLSTLETCRAYEDPQQGDPEEGFMYYNTGDMVGGGNDAAFVAAAANAGIRVGPGCSRITLSNNTSQKKLADSFVLCTTLKFDPAKLSDTFGKYCVAIHNTDAFATYVTRRLAQSHQLVQAVSGAVIYKERSFRGFENPPGPIGFVKPPDKYRDQHEFRFLWTSKQGGLLKPFGLEVPEIVGLCERVA